MRGTRKRQDKPGRPDNPEIPENPENPENPETPEYPEYPEYPENPEKTPVVELVGFEPTSAQGNHTLSTCLFRTGFSSNSKNRTTN